MELMPHIKALLDDLVSITKNMTVKRSDLAIANENDDDTKNCDNLYYEYKKIIDGELTYAACIKSDIPYNVLSNIYKWEKQDYTDSYNLTPDDSKTVNGLQTIFIRNKSISNEEGPEEEYLNKLGDVYIRQNYPMIQNENKQSISGSFVKLYRNTNTYRYTDIHLYEKYNDDKTDLIQDDTFLGIYHKKDGSVANDKIETEITIDDNNRVIFFDKNAKQIKLYVKDNKFSVDGKSSFFREIRYKRDEEYILESDVIDSFDIYETENATATGFSKDEKLDFYLEQLAAINVEADYIFYGGFADRNYEESQSYIYDSYEDDPVTGHRSLVKYVFDNDFGKYRLKRDTGDENLEVYYRRSFNEYYLMDDDSDGYVYVEKYSQVPYYYDKVDNEDYYEVSMPVYDDVTGDFKRDENGLILTEKTGIYETADNLKNDLDLETSIVYNKYYNNKSGLIDINETFINSNGDEVNRYKLNITTDNISGINVMYKTLMLFTEDSSGNPSEDNVKIVYITKEHEEDSYYEYYTSNKDGSFIFKDNKYIQDFEDETSDRFVKNVRYSPYFYDYNTITRNFKRKYLYDDDTFIYINPNIDIYSVVRLFSDEDIQSIWNNDYTMTSDIEKVIMEVYSEYIKDSYAPLRNNTDWTVTRYDGETNGYYRALNGLPPLDNMYNQPRIDRFKINEEYTGDDVNPYLYDLTDNEIDAITSNGMLANYMKLYPNSDYLRHLGRNRIDVCKARDAAPFEILTYGKYLNEEHLIMFSDAYKISKNYVIHNYYKPEMFAVNPYYGSYIAMLILVHALQICAAQSGDILTHNKYADYETVQLKLKSFGFENTFEHIPLVYRKNIAKNIELLIKNKGIDNIYDIVYKIFGIDDVEVFKYYFRKMLDNDGNPNISISQVPISSENVVRDIINKDNDLDYDTITNADKYWGVYEPKESVKKMFEEYPFNYMNSKYITLNNKFNLSKLNFSSSYYLNYVQEILSKNNIKFMISIDGFDHPISLKNLIIMLFAIQSVRFGFDGNIPSDIIATSAILKFNLSDEVTITGSEAREKSKLIEIINKYYNNMSNRQTYDTSNLSDAEKEQFRNEDKLPTINETEKYWRGKGKATNIINNILHPPKPPIVLPSEMTDTNALDIISQAYLDNLITDDTLTNNNDEGSLYETILRYRDDAKTYNDFICFNNLAKLLSISKMVKDNFKINSVWELIAEVEAIPDDNGIMIYKFDNSSWKYTDMSKVWIPTSTTDFVSNTYTKYNENITAIDGVYICNDIPDQSKASLYDYAINIGNIERYELKSLLKDLYSGKTPDGIKIYKPGTVFPENISISEDGINDANRYITAINGYRYNDIRISNGDMIFYNDKEPAEFFEDYKNKNPEFNLKSGTYYFKPEIVDNPICKIKLFRLSDYAYTYEMYLKYMENDLYKYLQIRDAEDRESYFNRLNELFSIIIATIENSLTSNAVRDSLSLSLVDFANIAKYIKIVIEVFKSYTIDLSSMDAIYSIDDKSQNRIKYIDSTTIDEKSYIYSNINMHSTVKIDDNIGISDSIGFKDEIIIESN